MNRLLFDYCQSQLTDSNYKEETNASFTKFIVYDAESIDDIRECDLLPFSTINYEYDYN